MEEESEVWTQRLNLGCDRGDFFSDSRTQGIPDSSRWQLGNRGRTHWRRDHLMPRVRSTDTLTQKEQQMPRFLIGKEEWSEHNTMTVAVRWEIIVTLKTTAFWYDYYTDPMTCLSELSIVSSLVVRTGLLLLSYPPACNTHPGTSYPRYLNEWWKCLSGYWGKHLYNSCLPNHPNSEASCSLSS